MPAHVIHFVHRYPPALGGAEAYVARLHEYLLSRGEHSQVWTTTAIKLEELWGSTPVAHASGSPIQRFPTISFPLRRYILKALSLIPHRPWQALTQPVNPLSPAMWRAAKSYVGPLDAVHATAFPYAFPILCAQRLAKRRGVPFLLTPFLHLGDPMVPHNRTRRQYLRPHLLWLLQQAHTIFAQTELERRAIIDLGIDGSRVVKQGLGVEPSECTGGNREQFRQNSECVLGHLANLSIEKGTTALLDAAGQLWDDGLNFRVILAGEEMPNFARYWRSYRWKDRVVKLGPLDATQKRDFYAGIDAFVLPSQSDSFGLVLLEAWANSKPVVVARSGGPAELVRDGVDGFVVTDNLADKLRELIASAELRERLGRAGLIRIPVEFQWQDKLEQFRRRFVLPN